MAEGLGPGSTGVLEPRMTHVSSRASQPGGPDQGLQRSVRSWVVEYRYRILGYRCSVDVTEQ
jgi:hypothetical protein